MHCALPFGNIRCQPSSAWWELGAFEAAAATAAAVVVDAAAVLCSAGSYDRSYGDTGEM